MRSITRIKEVFAGILMILAALIMMLAPTESYYILILFLAISLTFSGLRSIIYYFTMARHMVGGKAILYKGLIVLDLGIFTCTMFDIPQLYVMLYLLIIHAFSGAVDILRAFEAKRLDAAAWRSKFLGGVGNILIAVLAFVFGGVMNSVWVLVDIYSLGLIASACARIAAAFRPTAIVYIQ